MVFVLIWTNPVDVSLCLCAVAGDPSSKLAFANSLSESDPRFGSAIREVVCRRITFPPFISSARFFSKKKKKKEKKTKKASLFFFFLRKHIPFFETGVSLQDSHCEVWFLRFQPRDPPFTAISAPLFFRAVEAVQNRC
jgi:hypothetical protein